MPEPSKAGPDDGPGDHSASSYEVLRSEVFLPTVPALLGEVDVPMASCLARAVAFALPVPAGLVRLVVVVGEGEEVWLGG